ncbi:MAG: DUF1569 domain-containing protein [Oceanihabitans sp.]
MKNMFDKKVTIAVINRINKLENTTSPLWGKMQVDQMLAHCNVAYEKTYNTEFPKISGFKKFLLKLLIKPLVVNEKPYKKNGRTAPEFLITNQRNFEVEKTRLIDYINQTQELGAANFENKESHSFGKLSSKEWNNMFYKHLDHHLQQFGV